MSGNSGTPSVRAVAGMTPELMSRLPVLVRDALHPAIAVSSGCRESEVLREGVNRHWHVDFVLFRTDVASCMRVYRCWNERRVIKCVSVKMVSKQMVGRQMYHAFVHAPVFLHSTRLRRVL